MNRQLLPLVAFAIVAAPLAAQSAVTTGDLSGRVLSQGGKAPVPNAVLRLVSPATNRTHTLTADARGRFTFRLLHPGIYELAATAPGFQASQVRRVVVHLAANDELSVELVPAAGTATVEVVASQMGADTARTQVSTVVDGRQIDNLPINRRNFLDFSLTTPGVFTANSPENGGAAANSGLSFMGISPRQNSLLVDGLDNNDTTSGSVRSTFSQEAVQEFRVVPGGNFGVEYGRATGGFVNIVTKTGTNQFSGSAFHYYRDGNWDAKPVNADASSLRLKQSGFTVGGPIVKDKVFFFTAVERLDRTDANTVTIAPAAATAIRSAGFRLDTGDLPWSEVVTTGLAKLDWLPTAYQRITARFLWAKESNENQLPWGGLTAKTAGGVRFIEDKSLSLSHQWNITPGFTNDARVQVSQRTHNLDSLDQDNTVMVQILGVATFGTQRFLPQDRTERQIQFFDMATFTVGEHTLKGGLDLYRDHIDGHIPLNFAGVYKFVGLSAAIPNGLAAFTAANPNGGTGLPAQFVQGFGNPDITFDTTYTSLFLEDDWRVTPKLVLKAGLRWDKEDITPFRDTPQYQQLATPSYVSAGPNRGPIRIEKSRQAYDFDGALTPNLHWGGSRVAPRVAFSYQATDALRAYGGWGVFSGRTDLGPVYGDRVLNGQDGLALLRVVTAAASGDPWKSWANADGSVNHRYATAPAGLISLKIPGYYQLPENRVTNLGGEWSITPDLRATLDLTYSRGYGFLQVRDRNALVSNPYYNTDPSQSPNPAYRRPDLRFSAINVDTADGESRAFTQTLGVEWRKDNLVLRGSYTHTKAEDNYIDWITDYTVQNTFDKGQEWGPSNQQQAHRLVVASAWNPSKDWTLAVIGRVASGRPYTKLLGFDANGNGDATSDRPAGVRRNSESTPWTRSLDLRVAHAFHLGQAARLELSLDVFNVFNATAVTKVQGVLNAPAPASYGTPLAYDIRRQIQAGARFTF